MLNKIIKIVFLIAVLIATFSVAYYLVIFLPNKESQRQKQEREKIIIEDRKAQDIQRQEILERKTRECRDMGLKIYENEKQKWTNSPSIYALEPTYKYVASIDKCLYFGGERTMIGHNIHLINADTNEVLCSAGVLDDDYMKDKDTERAKRNIEDLEKCNNLASNLFLD